MNRLIICVLVLFSTQAAKSQIQLGIQLKTGIGEMQKLENSAFPFHLNEIDSEPAPTWGVSIQSMLSLHSHIKLSAELGYNHIQGVENEVYYITNIDNGAVTEYTAETTRKAHYISLPISLDFKIAPKVSIGTGISANYLLTNNRLSEYRANGIKYAIIGGGNDLNRFDLGLHLQSSIELSDKFILSAKGSWGMLNIRTPETRDAFSTFSGFDDSQQFEVKNRQFTLGITYMLLNNK